MAKKNKIRLDTENNDGLALWLVLVALTHMLFMIIASLTGLFPGLPFYLFQINLFTINTIRMHDSLYDDAQTLGVAPVAYELSKAAKVGRNLIGMTTFGLTIAAYALLYISPIAGLLFFATECMWGMYTLIKFISQAKNYLSDTNKNPYFSAKIASSSMALVQQLGIVAAITCLLFIPGIQLVVLPLLLSSVFVLASIKVWENRKLKEIEKELEENWVKEVGAKELIHYSNERNNKDKRDEYHSEDERDTEESQPLIEKGTRILAEKNNSKVERNSSSKGISSLQRYSSFSHKENDDKVLSHPRIRTIN